MFNHISKEKRTSEGDHQLNLFRWARKQSLSIPELGRLFHVPNGGTRNASTAARLKLEGVTPGVPDLCLPVARKGYHALWIELKTAGGKLSPAQSDWLDWLSGQGYCALTAYSADEARTIIVSYLGIDTHPDLLSLERERIG